MDGQDVHENSKDFGDFAVAAQMDRTSCNTEKRMGLQASLPAISRFFIASV